MTETKLKRRWFQISIRELLLLTAVVALAVGWWLDHRKMPDYNSVIWNTLGLKLQTIPPQLFPKSIYRGGLFVVEVRPGSPAANRKVLPGDVLVGINTTQTITESDVDNVLSQGKVPRFYILRRDEDDPSKFKSYITQ